MEKNVQFRLNLFSPEMQKEINNLSQEMIKINREIVILKKEIINITEKIKEIENQLKKSNNELKLKEENLSQILSKKYLIKLKQKAIKKSINKELFNIFINNIIKKENKYLKEILLLFFNFKDEYKDELKFIIQNKETFIDILNNSYKNLKILFKENINQYNEINKKIINLINNNLHLNNAINNNKFNYIIEYITNSFELIKYKNEIKKINDFIKKKNLIKNSIFLNKVLLENNKLEKEQNINNLEIYCKNANIIIDKCKNLNNIENEKEIINMILNLHQKPRFKFIY